MKLRSILESVYNRSEMTRCILESVYSYKNTENFDEEWQSYEFKTESGQTYHVYIEMKGHGGGIKRWFIRFKPHSKEFVASYDIMTGRNENTLKLLNTVYDIVKEFSKKFQIFTFFICPTDDKRERVFVQFIKKKGGKVISSGECTEFSI